MITSPLTSGSPFKLLVQSALFVSYDGDDGQCLPRISSHCVCVVGSLLLLLLAYANRAAEKTSFKLIIFLKSSRKSREFCWLSFVFWRKGFCLLFVVS